jgi:putative PIN family toxin of toxin-antitoxin system
MSPQGPAAALFDLIRSEHVLISSREIFSELSRVLAYDRMRAFHQLDDQDIDAFVGRIQAGSILVRLPSSIPNVVKADPDDDIVIATAIVGQAEAICTRNRHLYATDVIAYLKEWSIEVVDDVQLLALLRS